MSNASNCTIHYPNFTFGPSPTYPVDPWMPPGDQFPRNPQPLLPQPMNPPLTLPYWNPIVPAVPSWTDVKTPRLTLCTTCCQTHHSETCPFCIRNTLFRIETEISKMSQELKAFASGNEKLVRQMDALLAFSHSGNEHLLRKLDTLLTLTVELPKPKRVKAAKAKKPQKKAKRKKS